MDALVHSPHLFVGVSEQAIQASIRQGPGEPDDKYADRCHQIQKRLDDEVWGVGVRLSTITLGRFSKGPRPAVLVWCKPSGDGYKTRAMRLAESCKGKWNHRRGGYILSLKQSRIFETCYRLGLDRAPQ
jgi:hypothetical protein